jgi:hypothetical protein
MFGAVSELNWFWIALGLTAAPAAGWLIAYPIWRMGMPILGNIAGTIVIFAIAIGLIMREHVELDRIVQACLAKGETCWPEPSAFTRFAIYAFIALFEVIALFLVSLRVETALRRRGYDPEWQ